MKNRLPELEKLARDLNLSKKVDFLGERKDIPHHLSEADIYVQPSRSEGMGIALVEALASGLPVIITDSPGMREVINMVQGLGRVVPIEDPEALASAIAEYINFPNKCRHQAKLAKIAAKYYHIELTSDKLLGIYTQACWQAIKDD